MVSKANEEETLNGFGCTKNALREKRTSVKPLIPYDVFSGRNRPRCDGESISRVRSGTCLPTVERRPSGERREEYQAFIHAVHKNARAPPPSRGPSYRPATPCILLTTDGESLGHKHEQQRPTAKSTKYILNDKYELPLRNASLVLSRLGLRQHVPERTRATDQRPVLQTLLLKFSVNMFFLKKSVKFSRLRNSTRLAVVHW